MSNHRDPAPEWLNANYLQDILREHINDKTLEVKSIDVNPGSNEGENYCCQVFRITIHLNRNNKEESLSHIGKLKPSTTLVNEFEKIIDMFEVEANFFSILQPKLNEIIGGIENAKEYTPKCYHVDYNHKIIFMEDLKVKGFELLNRSKFLSLAEAEKVMQALATFHGASLHVLKRDPDLKNTFNKYMWTKEINESMRKLIKNSMDSLSRHVDSYGLPENYRKKLLGTLQECDDGIMEVVDVKEGKINVLCHGDCWMNNMMFHFQNGVPDDIVLLDFQIVNYNSFANDLQYFLFTSVKSEVLDTSISCLLETYFLKLKQIAPEDSSITFDRIKSEFEERYYFGYFMAIVFRSYSTAETPVDLDTILVDGALQDNGFTHPAFIKDLKVLLPIFEKHGVIN